ncbi:hypothetical protein D7X33_22405 [Butyricicoccus sp. 1XD8-22]|nr:hypothetical protein D7X33_22405 [Butyricicoccus sp. 1XD8-22]
MNTITPEALEFLEEAKTKFENIEAMTYNNNEFIALRSGFREDSLIVYELGNEVGFFTEVLPSQHTVVVHYDDLILSKKRAEKYDKLLSALQFFEKEGKLDQEVVTYISIMLNEK